MKDVFSHGEKSLELRKNEKFLILRPMRCAQGQDLFIARNSRGLTGEVAKRDLSNLRLPDWFLMLDRRAAETQLANSPPGKFIIRPTTHGKDGEYSVSVKYRGRGDVHHFKLIFDTGRQTWSMWGQHFRTLQEFVKAFQEKAIAKKGPEKVRLDPLANVQVLVVENDEENYYNGQEESEEETYEDAPEEEESDEGEFVDDRDNNAITEGCVVVCTDEYVPEEEGTVYIRPGDRLVVLYSPTDGWVYVRSGGREEGYVPEDCVQIERR